MLYSDLSRMAVSVGNLLIVAGFYHQAWAIWSRKSARDFTWTLVAALVISEAAWLNYGVAIHEWPIILAGALNTPAIVLMVVGFLRYHKGSNDGGKSRRRCH